NIGFLTAEKAQACRRVLQRKAKKGDTVTVQYVVRRNQLMTEEQIRAVEEAVQAALKAGAAQGSGSEGMQSDISRLADGEGEVVEEAPVDLDAPPPLPGEEAAGPVGDDSSRGGGGPTLPLRAAGGEAGGDPESIPTVPNAPAVRVGAGKKMARYRDLLEAPGAGEKYLVKGEIARGGMGAILRALDRDLRREVAMKVILPGASRNRSRLARFLEEGQVTGQLEHPNIVPVHELSKDPAGRYFFTMKLVRGEALDKILHRLAEKEEIAQEEYPLGRLLEVFLKVADAISFAHSKMVVHRDLKPANIMVGGFGEVLVMDWGLAKLIGHADGAAEEVVESLRSEDDTMMTLDGSVAGTPSYMPPEQAAGRVNEIDERSDVYALGAILYEMLTLFPPYTGKNAREIVDKVLNRQIRSPLTRNPDREPPPELAAVAMKALSRQPADRYPSVEDMARDVRLFIEGRSVSAKRDTPLQMAVKWVRRNRILAGGIAATVVAIILTVVGVNLWQASARNARVAEEFASGEARMKSGDWKGAERLFYSVLSLDPDHAAVRDRIAEVGYQVQVQRKREEARALLPHAEESFNTGYARRAREEYTRVLALDPQNEIALARIDAVRRRAEAEENQARVRDELAAINRKKVALQGVEEEIARVAADVAQRRDNLKGPEPLQDKRGLWNRQRQLEQKRAERESLAGEALRAYNGVLLLDTEAKEARAGLAGMYLDRFREAEEKRDNLSAIYYRDLTLQYHDGKFANELKGDGSLRLATAPGEANVFVFRYEEGADRRLIPAPFRMAEGVVDRGFMREDCFGMDASDIIKRGSPAALWAATPAEPGVPLSSTLPMGSYLLLILKEGYVPTRLPVLIERNEKKSVDVRLYPIDEVADPSMIFIPAGEFSFGGDPRVNGDTPRRRVNLPDYFIGWKEILVSQYLEFLNDDWTIQKRKELEDTRKREDGSPQLLITPRRSHYDSPLWFPAEGGKWTTKWPLPQAISNVSQPDAALYCEWLNARAIRAGKQRLRYRLPTEQEWEKAARGADARWFPFGNHFDWMFLHGGNSFDQPNQWVAAGKFTLDESPYGVVDMTGGMAEWTADVYSPRHADYRAIRGGGWAEVAEERFRVAVRNYDHLDNVNAVAGFRIAATPVTAGR
ncbi:MAG: SUMF1/EgtB/PvdO family nonheme iron enzyme, partial [Planctomycetes bacterium]|nr:SUMF1/EgtB/PvdO family nonheme iron enzyme [Planctomycetota bacterium]